MAALAHGWWRRLVVWPTATSHGATDARAASGTARPLLCRGEPMARPEPESDHAGVTARAGRARAGRRPVCRDGVTSACGSVQASFRRRLRSGRRAHGPGRGPRPASSPRPKGHAGLPSPRSAPRPPWCPCDPGAPAGGVHARHRLNDPDESARYRPGVGGRRHQWHALGDDALRRWASVLDPAAPAGATLWPEHFDVAIEVDAITYGASPGDDDIVEPYLYVGTPADRRSSDRFWNAPFGAASSWVAISDAPDAVRFFQSGHRHLKR